MSNLRVRVTGLRELLSTLDQVDREIEPKLKAIYLDAAREVADAVRAPVRTGRLAASVKAQATRRGAVVKAGGVSVPYAAPIHFGWLRRHIRPQPFLYDALDARADAVIQRFEDGFERLMDTIHGA